MRSQDLSFWQIVAVLIFFEMGRPLLHGNLFFITKMTPKVFSHAKNQLVHQKLMSYDVHKYPLGLSPFQNTPLHL